MNGIWENISQSYGVIKKYTEKIGILGGTYDPVHIGHTDIAEKIYREFSLSYVMLMVSGTPPHKTHTAPAADRFAMLNLAVSGLAHIKVSDIELDRGGYVYTADTLKLIAASKPNAELFYIIGSDTVFELETWRDFETVFSLCSFICMDRAGVNPHKACIKAAELKERFGAKIAFSLQKAPDVSSTLIRRLISQGGNVSQYLDKNVEEYIASHGLYK